MKKSDKIKVSVLCAVYNHEKYLDECLNSLVNQKTNFEYEILVHDDCSTDNSKKIIEKYYKEYPNIIVPFFEEENQYSKGVRINIDILIPKMRGKYFCFCEGDDYWIDSNKLQKQYDFLENNKEYKFCVHNSIGVNKKGKKICNILPLKDGGELSCEEFIKNGGAFVSTNSIFSYSSLAKKLPNYFNILTLDYIWQIYLSSCGKTYCFKDKMSAYRMLSSDNSWTYKLCSNTAKHIKHKNKVITCLKKFNEETNYKYNNVIESHINEIEFDILILKRDYESLKKKPYKDIYNSKPFKIKLKYYLDEHHPNLYNIIKRIGSKV